MKPVVFMTMGVKKGPLSRYGIMGLQGKNLGLLQKSALNLGLWISYSTKFGFSSHSKLGLWDFTLFQIGITGLCRF